MNIFEIQSQWDGDPEVRDPSELSDVEQEARQTGQTVEEVTKAATPKAKTAAKKAAKVKPAKKSAAKKPSKEKAAPKAKKAAKPKKAVAATTKRAKAASGAPKAKLKTGPKGSKNPVRAAKDGGVFGRKVDRARKEKGWTQTQLAEKVELTQPAVCNIIKGTVSASEKAQKRFCKVLGIK